MKPDTLKINKSVRVQYECRMPHANLGEKGALRKPDIPHTHTPLSHSLGLVLKSMRSLVFIPSDIVELFQFI